MPILNKVLSRQLSKILYEQLNPSEVTISLPPVTTNLFAFYDASQTDLGAVSTLPDLSGNNRDGTSSAQPTNTASQINGKNAFVFNGSNKIELPSDFDSIPAGESTVFAVFKQDSIGATETIFNISNSSSVYRYSMSINNEMNFSNSSSGTSFTAGIGTDSYSIGMFNYDGISSVEGSLNDGLVTLGSADDVTGITSRSIGERGDGTLPLTGGISELIFYDRKLSEAEIGQMYSYLSSKYSISITYTAEDVQTSNRKVWLDASDTSTITQAFDDKTTTVSTIEGNTFFTVASDMTGLIFPGDTIRIDNSDDYIVESISTTTINITTPLVTSYGDPVSVARRQVTQIDDKFLQGNDFSNNQLNLQPVSEVDSRNGNNVITFYKPDSLTRLGMTGLNGDIAWYMVARVEPLIASVNATILAFQGSQDVQYDASSATQFDFRANFTSNPVVTATGGPYQSEYIIYSGTLDSVGNIQKIYINGVEVGSGTYNFNISSTQDVKLATNRGGSQKIDMKLGEFIMYDAIPTTNEDSKLIDSLIKKWNIPNFSYADLSMWNAYDVENSIIESSGSVSQTDGIMNTFSIAATQGTGANQPTTGTNTINGLNVISYDGNDYLDAPFLLNPATSNFTVFVVGQFGSLGTTEALIQQLDGTGTGRGWLYGHSSNVLRSNVDGTLLSGDAIDTNPNVYGVKLDSGTLSNFVNINAPNTLSVTPDSTTDGGTRIGANKSAAAGLSGNLGEILIFDTALSDATVGEVLRYLKTKWGV